MTRPHPVQHLLAPNRPATLREDRMGNPSGRSMRRLATPRALFALWHSETYLATCSTGMVRLVPSMKVTRARRTVLDAAEAEAVRAARVDNASWAAVGAGLGISKQAANQRFGEARKVESQAPAPEEAKRASARPTRSGWEIAIPGRRALLHIRPRRDDAR